MVRLKPDDWASARGRFLYGEAALKAFEQRMHLDNFDPDDDGVQALRP